MNRKFLVFAIITLIVIVAAGYLAVQRAPQTTVETTLLYPHLLDRINDIDRIEIHTASGQTRILKKADHWVIGNRDDFPAVFGRIREMVVNLARLKVLEQKTSNPELYPRLRVEGTVDKPGSSTLLRLWTGNGETLVDLVIGKRREGKTPALYVRPAQQAASLLVAGGLEVDARPAAWMDKDIMSIGADRIRALVIRHADGETLRLDRPAADKKNLTLHDIPAGQQAKSQVTLNSYLSLLEELRLRDVRARASLNTEKPGDEVVITTFDGLRVRLRHGLLDDHQQQFTTFDVSVDDQNGKPDDKVRDEAAKLQRKLGHWAYLLPGFKTRMLTRKMADLLKPIPAGKGK